MNMECAKFMRYGKLVVSEHTGETYKLIEDMDSAKECVSVVNMNDWARYELLIAWERNWESNCSGFRECFTSNIEDCKLERQGYEQNLKCADILPKNEVRFIRLDYKPKFIVQDLSFVSVDGTIARVAYIDECHFTFVDKIAMNFYGGCFHICQFAEICENNGIEVKPVE